MTLNDEEAQAIGTGVMGEVHAGTFETSFDLGSASIDGPPAFQVIPYDPSKDRESVRGWIALSLISLLAVVVLFSFAFTWAHPDRSRDLHDLLALLLGPLVALVGAATGYYFGSQAGQGK